MFPAEVSEARLFERVPTVEQPTVREREFEVKCIQIIE
jgi:hypothetical protein